MKNKLRRNIYLFNLYSLFNGLWLFSALAVVYFQEVCQSYTLAILAYSLVSLSQSITEVPLGVISDRWGRKINLSISAFLLFLNMFFWALAGSSGSIWMLFAGSVFRGLGLSFLSGTDAAFLYETAGDLRCRKMFDKIYSKAMGYSQLGLLISAAAATIVTYYAPIIVLAWLSVIPALLKIFLALLLKEPKSNFEDGISPREQIKKSFRLLLSRKKLRNYTIMQVLSSSLVLSIYRFEILYYAQLIPLYLINIVRIIMHAMGYVSFLLVNTVRRFNFLRVLFFSTLGAAAIRGIGLLLNNALTPFLAAFSNIAYGIGVTAQTTLLQKEYHKSLRATMSSLSELLRGFAIAIIGYLFGLLADVTSPRMALVAAIALQIILAALYNRLFKMYRKS